MINEINERAASGRPFVYPLEAKTAKKPLPKEGLIRDT
jgi:hypothetical protein